eukprot:2882266-Rhodomonas_salina.1
MWRAIAATRTRPAGVLARVRCRMHAPRASAMACACARLRQEIQCHATHGARIVVLVLCDAMCGARIVFGPV